MPRAFLITHRRYNAAADGDQRESSPEHKVTLPESSPLYLTSRAMSPSPTDCPDELYNLTKLAEVSLAAASGQLYHHRHLSTIPLPPSPPGHPQVPTSAAATGYTHKLFDRDRDRSGSVGQQAQSEQEQSAQHECPDCGKRYSTSSNLARHRQTHRSLADKKARRCPHCDKVYVSMPAYSMHVRTHVQGCRCPYCGKCFSRPWLLQGHIRTHTGEKPFRCPQCQKAFADKSNLRAHVQTHSDTKPHVCSRCGKAFALKSYLYKHEESSCMRHTSKPGVPTPVIVRPSVISAPRAERVVHGQVERPAPTVMAGRCCVPLPLPMGVPRAPREEEQPVDFSTREYSEDGRREYVGMAIAV